MDERWHEVQERYDTERQKRLQSNSSSGYIKASETFLPTGNQWHDPWAESSATNSESFPLKAGCAIPILIVGAGYSGLLFAIRLLDIGFKHEDMVISDMASGFGGTWYWNRYPGLQCDAESYIYMPLLEELNYIPSKKYCSGPEIRRHAEAMAEKYKLQSRAAFCTKTECVEWNENERAWHVTMSTSSGGGKKNERFVVQANFVILATGLFVYPRLPRITGLNTFEGHTFLACRWDYNFTGGSPDNPALTKLAEKSVGIIGTGASAVQVLPQVARYAKQVVLFQRTPASVDYRANHETNHLHWRRDVATEPGWQAKRRWNFFHCVSNLYPHFAKDMVKDAASASPSLSAILGSPNKGVMDQAAAQRYHAELSKLDFVRQERLRKRVNDIVHDKRTAQNLQNWYPSWCKRPLFSDEYLSAFNRKNVKLVDTDGRGVESITESSVIAGGIEHHVDCLIFATGYSLPFQGNPGSRAGIEVRGKGGRLLSEKWAEGPRTLHGMWTHGFPNLFWSGPEQAAFDINYTNAADHFAEHVAFIIENGVRKGGSFSVSIEPDIEAEREWTEEVISLSNSSIGFSNCTPSYYNNDGKSEDPETDEKRRALVGRSAWGDGLSNYVNRLEAWRAAKSADVTKGT